MLENRSTSGRTNGLHMRTASVLVLLAITLYRAGATPSGTRREKCGGSSLQYGQICCNGIAREQDDDRICCQYEIPGSTKEVYIHGTSCDGVDSNAQFPKCGTLQIHLNYNAYQDCCGDAPYDLQLSKCCVGLYGSTVIPRDTPCCNGRPVKAGEMCCSAGYILHKPVRLEHSSHTKCCVNPENTTEVRTYDDSVHKCNFDNGKLQSKDPEQKMPGFLFGKPPPSSTTLSNSLPNVIVPPDSDKEETKYCGHGDSQPYLPSKQMCCINTVHNYSSGTPACCGEKLMDRETDLCCDGNVFKQVGEKGACCGENAYNGRTHSCCDDRLIVDRRKHQQCCNSLLPYHTKSMRCNRATSSVTLRRKAWSSPSKKLCKNELVPWERKWQLPTFSEARLQIRGRVETCDIQFSRKFINIPLSPAIVISGGKEMSDCLVNDQLVLTVRKPRSTKCLSEMELVEYLRGKTLYVYTRNRRRLQCASKKLTIKNKDKAFILVSGENDAMFKDILREKRVWWK